MQQFKVIIIAWMIMGFLISVYDHLVLLTDNTLGLSPQYSFWVLVARNVGAGLVGGLLGGGLLVFYVNVKYQDKPYGYTMLFVSIAFILVIIIVTVLIGVILIPLRTGKSLSDPESMAAFRIFLADTSHPKAALAWSFVVAMTQLLLQVNSKFGQADFWNIIRGKYNRPKEEKRIFMFLDLNSSTKMAEDLGNETYHSLLKDFFADITNPILDNRGAIYQYVGDEVVIAWNYQDGIENINCLHCFFDMKKCIEQNKEKYLDRYGLVPSFKAGIHCGRVIAGEIGIIKRDITYSGDVLNTTSRILGKCGELKEEMIASSDLLSKLYFDGHYVSRPLGAIRLKGKEKEVMLNGMTALVQPA